MRYFGVKLMNFRLGKILYSSTILVLLFHIPCSLFDSFEIEFGLTVINYRAMEGTVSIS